MGVEMTKRRQIAIAYTFAIPILFAYLMFEVGALYPLDAHERQMAQDSAASRECDSLESALHDAEAAARGYASSGSGNYQAASADASSRIATSVARLDHLSKTDPAMQAKVHSLRELTSRRFEQLQTEMDARNSQRAAGAHSALEGQGASMTAEIEQAVAGIRADIETRSQQEQAEAARSASTVDRLVKYGRVVTIWIVGVAALLLFYDDSERFRGRVEKRLHTDILESLPLPVCLTTETGSILYVNPAAEAAFGYKPGELVARNVALLHDASSGSEPSLAEVFARLTPHEMWCGQLPIRTIAGVLAVAVFVILIFRMRKSTSR
jgi:CHASE3 domain sensor protein